MGPDLWMKAVIHSRASAGAPAWRRDSMVGEDGRAEGKRRDRAELHRPRARHDNGPRAPKLAVLEATPDNLEHDLRGAAIDPLDAGVSPQPRDLEVVHIARPTMKLERAVDDLPLRFRVPIFGG